jgi:hypothetical protein
MKSAVKISTMIVLAAAALAAGYYLSFQLATVRSSGPGHFTLHVAGLSFDYNKVTGRRFSSFYGPLLERRFEQEPEIRLDATFSQLRDAERAVSFKREGRDGIRIRYGAEHEGIVRSLRRGDPVAVAYKLRPLPENPFASYYQMVSISRR